MTSKNEFTGDLQQTKALSKEGQANHERIFGNTVKRGRYKQCRETGKFIHINEWNKRYGSAPKPKGPMIFCNHFEPYVSPVTNEVISSKREHQYDLDTTGCRVYEGQGQEQKEVDRYLAREDEKLDEVITEDMEQTYHDIEHGHKVIDESGNSNSLSWTFGDD